MPILFQGLPDALQTNSTRTELLQARPEPIRICWVQVKLEKNFYSKIFFKMLRIVLVIACKDQISQRANSKPFQLIPNFCLQKFGMVEVNGIEPMTSCVQGRRSPS